MVLRVHPLRYVLDYPAASSIFPSENQQHLQESHIARVQDVQVFGVPRCKSPRRSRSQQLQAQQVEPQNHCLFCAQMWINPIQLLFCIWLGVTLVKIIQHLNGSTCDIPNIAKSVGLAHPFQPRPVPIPRCSLRLSTSPSWRFFRGSFRVLGVALILMDLPSSTSSTIVSSWSLPGPSTLALEARQKKRGPRSSTLRDPIWRQRTAGPWGPWRHSSFRRQEHQPATPPRNWLAIQHMIILYIHIHIHIHIHTYIYIIYDSPNQCPWQHLPLVPLGGGALIGAAVSKPPRRQPWRLGGLPVNLTGVTLW